MSKLNEYVASLRADFNRLNSKYGKDWSEWRNVAEDIDAIEKAVGKPLYAVGVSVLLTRRTGLLLGRRKNNSGAGLLSTPGGRLEFNETVEEGARREFKEETGAEVGELTLIDWKKLNRFGNHYFMFYMHAKSWTGDISNMIPDKSEDWHFYDMPLLDEAQCTEPTDIMQRVWELVATDKLNEMRAGNHTWNIQHD